MILVSCEQFANFLDKVSKSTRTIKGNVKLSLSNYDENYRVSTLTVNSVEMEVISNNSNLFECDVSIQYIRNLRNYLRTVPEQPFKIIFEDNVITPILECPTPRWNVLRRCFF